jgi:hypothetical protein
MKNNEDHLLRSIEIVKSGFENAQGRITFIDTKVGIAVGVLVVLLPIPLVAVNWLTGLRSLIILARARRQGRTLHPASPPLTALASPKKVRLGITLGVCMSG